MGFALQKFTLLPEALFGASVDSLTKFDGNIRAARSSFLPIKMNEMKTELKGPIIVK